jgi:PAS domain S-box-containing protein
VPAAHRLREGLEQFRLAQEALGIVTWIWDADIDRVQWHGDASRLLGLEPHTFGGRFEDWLKHVHPDDAGRARQNFIDCLKGRRPQYRTLERVVWRDGSVHWVETYGRASYGADGRAERLTGAIKDVTERKREEAARLRAEQQLARVFDAALEASVMVRADDGLLLAANPAFERLTGWAAEDIVGRTVGEIKLWGMPGDREGFLADLRRDGRITERPVQVRTRDGRLLSGLLSASISEHEGEQVIISMMRDTTEAKRLERRARQSERKYAALFDTSPVAMIVTRPSDRRVVEINDAALRLLGLERERAIGALSVEIARPLDLPGLEAVRSRALAGDHIAGHPASFKRQDGQHIDTILSLRMVELDGEPHLVISALDVTQAKQLERRARQSERKYEALFETSPEAIAISRRHDGVTLAVNAAWESMIGHGREAVIFRPAGELGLWRSVQEREEVIRRLDAEGVVRNHATRLKRADGSEIDVLLSSTSLEIDGELCVVWSWRDVTEERRAESARHAADARYRALFETARDGFVISTAQHAVLDVNPAACTMTGYTREELVGMHVSRLLGKAELAARPLRRDLGERWLSLERVITRKDGSALNVEIVAGPMPDGSVLAMMRDITERKRNDTLLMNIARGVSAEVGVAFFESLVRHLASELGADFAFIGELTPDGRMHTHALLADGAMAPNPDYTIAGSMSERALAERRTVVFSSGVRERFAQNVEMRKNAVEAYVGTPLFAADGSALGVLAVAHRKPIEREHFWASMIEIFGARAAAEIERERAEQLVRRTNESLEQVVHARTAELEQANRDLESYNYSISHDLRQPLNAIAGFADLLRERARGTEDAEWVGEIESNAARMEQMIEALLRLARAGRGAITRKPVDSRALVESVLRDLSVGAPLAAEVSLGELPTATGDEVLLRQVWMNLIGNALKYSRYSAAPRVEIDGRRRAGGVEFTVRDNGVGFDMGQAERLFGAFQRLPSALDFEGSGVGLAIVERVVRRHGGAINAESAPGHGASFRFTLPD